MTFERTSFQSSTCFLRCGFGGFANFRGAYITNADFSGAHFHSADFSSLQHAGSLNFSEAVFDDVASFEKSEISTAHFERATFSQGKFWFTKFIGYTSFESAEFRDYTSFESSEFRDGADFSRASFRQVNFSDVQFLGTTMFHRSKFESGNFTGASFTSPVVFAMAHATNALAFGGTTFERHFMGPVSARYVLMTNAVFGSVVRVEVTAEHLSLSRTRFEAPAAFHVRHAVIDLTDVNPSFPVTIASHSEEFTSGADTLIEDFATEGDALGKISSLKGVDAALLVLNDIDLRRCTFEGSYHLDQIKLDGRCRFSTPPQGARWGKAWIPIRLWTQRKVLEEERVWRASTPIHELDKAGWGDSAPPNRVADSQDIAATYRQLRKALEDGLNEPGAADFYYGEMEMRRRDHEISVSERGLLHSYWALSGYGLRASRAIGWLLSAMAVTVLLMMGLGLPNTNPKQEASGIVSSPGAKTTLVLDKPEPTLNLPVRDRFTSKRLEKAGQIVLNSVVFRSSGQDLTTAGTWIEMISRFTEPVLLGFAALAVRGRIKRS
ncbi:pentapeptide repeat-containing protein [Streptomyces sp. NPDC059862]|uniref:pentapeptide repeat-containing protein n=1 Tax=Streptomyces sp. NPDC059862 TaxID=3346975 RepID=UPI00365F2AAD